MYLEHFKLKELPFSLTPNVEFFCHLRGHQEALNTLLFSLNSGEGFIKIVGEVGSGKTLLCRKLLNSLGDEFITAYIPNPDLNPTELRRALLRELNVDPAALQDQPELLAAINQRLLQLHAEGKQVVLLIDEAQALPSDTLEALRLLTNLETEKNKLMQIVLFGQPELDDRLNQNSLRQFKQRICFSYYLPKMTREELDTYLFHRLAVAGQTYNALFSKRARKILFKASQGVPRLINILCHKSLLVTYGKGESQVDHKAVTIAVRDTEAVEKRQFGWSFFLLIGLTLFAACVFYVYRLKGIL